MLSPINSELEENYNKRRILRSFVMFMLLIFMVVMFIALQYPDLILIGILIFVVIAIAISYTPYLSKYDLIRYHLKKLIESSKSGHTKKFKKHINKLAYYIFEFNSELENIFLLSSTKQILDKFLILLRYQIDPRLTESDIKSYSNTLEEIYTAMDTKNIKFLNETLVTFIEENKFQKSAVLLSYETPSISERITKKTVHLIKNNKSVNFIVKFSFAVFVLVSLAYFLSPKLSFLEFDNYIFGVLLIVALGIANKI